MNKKIGIIKRRLAILLIIALSINSFAAVVSDNDGSAFITKAEFDSLKNNFQAQIDQYNTSIDSKIDGAIAQYLAGIKFSTTLELRNLYSESNGNTAVWRPMILSSTNMELPANYIWWFSDVFARDQWLAYFSFSLIKAYNGSVAEWDGVTLTGNSSSDATKYLKSSLQKQIVVYEKDSSDKKYLKYRWNFSNQLVGYVQFYGSHSDDPIVVTYDMNSLKSDKNASFSPVITGSNYSDCITLLGTGNSPQINMDKELAFRAISQTNILLNKDETGKFSHTFRDEWTMDYTDATPRPWINYTVSKNDTTNGNKFGKLVVKNWCIYNYDDVANGCRSDYSQIKDLYYGSSIDEYPVKLYEGLPLTTTDKEGKITITGLQFSGTSPYYFSIKDSPFTNSNTLDASNITLNPGTGFSKYGNYYQANGTGSFDITFDKTSSGPETYYIKLSNGKTAYSNTISLKIDSMSQAIDG